MGLPGSQHGTGEGTLGAPRRPSLESLSARGRRAAQQSRTQPAIQPSTVCSFASSGTKTCRANHGMR